MEVLQGLQLRQQQKEKPADLSFFHYSWQKILLFLQRVRSIGVTPALDDYEKRKLGIFNQLNFFQLITGTIVPAIGLLHNSKYPAGSWLMACLPSLISFMVLFLNARCRYRNALLTYFIFYPVLTSFVYLNRLNLGAELSFILYGILSVFFLQEIGYMIFAISLSMVSYYVLFTIQKQFAFPPEPVSVVVYLLSHALTIVYIFVALYLIKKENTGYQFSILAKNRELHKKTLEIEMQRTDISEKANLLEKQAAGLRESNGVKNKLFSIISHDLRAPMFALRNFFQHAGEQNLSGDELKLMMPEIMNDLNYSTTLIENLLQWAKSQMQADMIRPQKLDVSQLVNEVVGILHLQYKAKKIQVETRTDLPAYAYADKDMISLVIRNLLSNAIKFTPEKGHIVIGTYESLSCVEVFVQDSGKGISREEMKKINKNNFYSTNGTKEENGTGLGLMLCKEFLVRNEGRLMIESEPGKGSTFSFTLPLA